MSELTWYAVKENSTIYHCGVSVAKGKKILLDENQADLHGSERIESCDPPQDSTEVAVLSEYQKWSGLNKLPATKASVDEKTSAKRDRTTK
jgi:hypothetical protein